MNKAQEKILRGWLQEINVKLAKGALNLDAIMKLTSDYITQEGIKSNKWQLVGIAALGTQVKKQAQREIPIERLSNFCAGVCPISEIKDLYKHPFFTKYLTEVEGTSICGYPVKRRLGSGAYGTVSIVEFQGAPRALKINLSDVKDWGFDPLIELDVTTRIYHPNLVLAEALVLPEEKTCAIDGYGLILPLGIGDVSSLASTLLLEDKLLITYEMLQGLRCLHQNHILHGDIKPANIIAFNKPEEKENGKPPKRHPYFYRLADFGIARYLNPQTDSMSEEGDIYSLTYRPPEGFGSHEFTPASDIWALGATLFELITGTYVISDYWYEITGLIREMTETGDATRMWKRTERKVKAVVEEEPILTPLLDLLNKMLNPNQGNRPLTEELLSHEVFRNLGPNPPSPGRCTARNLPNSDIRGALRELAPEDRRDHPLPYQDLEILEYLGVPLYGAFQAIDLFYMAYPVLQKKGKPTERDATVFFLTSVCMVAKFYGNPDVYIKASVTTYKKVKEHKITNEEFLTTEKTIVEHLGGRLVRKSYYDVIRNDGHFRAYLRMVFKARDYLASNIPQEWADGVIVSDPDQTEEWDFIGNIEDLIKELSKVGKG